MEIAGAAWGTVLAQFLQMGLLMAIFLSPHFHRRFGTRTHHRFDWRRTRELVRIGIPSGFTLFLEAANWGLFISFIVGRVGEVPLAATNIAVAFLHLSFMPAVGLSEALTPIVAHWIGHKDLARAKARTYTGIKLSVIYMAVIGITFAVFGEPIIRSLFAVSAATVQLGGTLLIIAAVFQGFDGIAIACTGALRGAGDTRWMMVVMFMFTYPLFLPLASICTITLEGGALGAWLAATAYVIGFSFVLFWRFHSNKWHDIKIFQDTEEIQASP